MLALESVNAAYGHVQVLREISLDVGAGEVLALLGRNGAGKTTLIRTVMGLVPKREGSIRLDGVELSRLAPHEIPAHGVAYVPQGRRLFPHMSVAENLQMGLLAGGSGADALDWVLELFPPLRERLDTPAVALSGGQQQMVAMGRALCVGPKVMLLDEPSEGLQPSMVKTVLDTIERLRESGVAVLLVEQKVEAALAVAERVAFIENGRIVHETSVRAVREDPSPLARYVGVRAARQS